jgi:aryl-alcohol dehydrogenase-like predicted oxidoreductase
MHYRQLGRTGPKVSVIGLGGNTFGRTVSQTMTTRICDAARDQGINTIDTADVYGKGLSERMVGRAIASRHRDWILMTKFGYPMDSQGASGGASRRYIREAVEASLKRLGTDYIDLYQVHRPDPNTPIAETLAALDDLVTAGKVRYIGCSNYPGWQVAESQWIARTHGWTGFAASQMRYNLLERNIEAEHLPACGHYGLGLIAYSPLMGGFLTGKYRRAGAPPQGTRYAASPAAERILTEGNFRRLEKLAKTARECDLSMTQLAIGWLLAQARVSCVIISATGCEQVVENAGCARVTLPAGALQGLNELTSSLGQAP